MAEGEKEKVASNNEKSIEPQNILSILTSIMPKIPIQLSFPFFNQQKHSKNADVLVKEDEKIEIPKPTSVFIGNRQKFPPPLEIEPEDCAGKNSNPIVLWQVYAIGGIFMLKWIWARWKERKEMEAKKNESSDDEQPPTDADADVDYDGSQYI